MKVNFQKMIGMCAEAHKGNKVERNILSTTEFKSAKADMGNNNEI